MTIWRSRTDFWGNGPPWREASDFSFHHLAANEPEEEVEPHGHEEPHFVLVMSGGYMSSARDAPIVSATPILIYNPAGTEHQDRFHQGRGTFLAISGGPDHREDSAICIRDPDTLEIARRVAAIIDHGSNFSLEGHALQLHATVLPISSDEARYADMPPSWLRRAVEMIHTSNDAMLGVACVAAEMGVHPVHLARVFRRYLGCVPGEYLRGHRLERAAAIIGQGVASLADAALAAGYTDQAHLNRHFREHLRTTPGKWRALRHVARIQDGEVD